MRLHVFIAFAFSLQAACGGDPKQGDGGLSEQPLAACLPGWWTTSGTKCIVEPACDSPTSPDLSTVCASTDCGGAMFYGFESAGTQAGARYHKGRALRSTSNRLFCVMGAVSENSWSIVDAGQIGIPSPPIAVRCFGGTVDLAGIALYRASTELQAALTNRAAQGSWSGCAY